MGYVTGAVEAPNSSGTLPQRECTAESFATEESLSGVAEKRGHAGKQYSRGTVQRKNRATAYIMMHSS